MIAHHDLQSIILHHINVTDMRLENPKTNAKQGDIYRGMRIALLAIHRSLSLSGPPEDVATKLAVEMDKELEYV